MRNVVIFETRSRELDWRMNGQALPNGAIPVLLVDDEGTQVRIPPFWNDNSAVDALIPEIDKEMKSFGFPI